ncbi:hypothetical protein D3C78_1713630 [compost metagenome]
MFDVGQDGRVHDRLGVEDQLLHDTDVIAVHEDLAERAIKRGLARFDAVINILVDQDLVDGQVAVVHLGPHALVEGHVNVVFVGLGLDDLRSAGAIH